MVVSRHWSLVLAAFSVLFLADVVAGLKCLSCKDITHPQFCKQTVTCGAGETCGIERFISLGGDMRYSLDCIANQACSDHGKNVTYRTIHNIEHIRQCLQCCHGDLCNSGGCGESSFAELGKTVCYQCQYEDNPGDCTTIEACNTDEICYLEETRQFKQTYYNSGCRRRTLCNALRNPGTAIGRRKREDLCVHCCGSSLCNNRCGNTTGSCKDQPECASLMSNYQVCQDTRTATQICPKSCGRCHTDTTASTVTHTLCHDLSPNCQYMQNKFQICTDRVTVDQLGCRKTCGYCGNVGPTSSPVGRPTDNSGQEFIFEFIENYSSSPQLTLYVLSEGRGYFNVTIPHRSIHQRIDIDDKLVMYNISSTLQPTALSVERKGILVESNVPIYLFAWNGEEASSDGFNVLPTHQLSRNYTVPSLKPHGTSSTMQSQISVVSPSDGNNITFGLVTPQSFQYNGSTYRNGQKLKVKLNKMETFALSHSYSLTGTNITGTKPFAVVSGNRCNKISGACSHLSDMIPPSNTFDKIFIIPKFSDQNIKLQIMANTNNTRINITSSSSVIKNLNAGDFYETNMTSASVVNATNGVLVTQYIYSGNFDPSMMVVPGINQYLSNYTFVVLLGTPSDSFSNSLKVIIKHSALNGLFLDGKRISNYSTSNVRVGNETYDYFSMSTKPGYHNMYNEHGVPFGLFVFGRRKDDSYAYAAGKKLTSHVV